jgi:hypothetical protein
MLFITTKKGYVIRLPGYAQPAYDGVTWDKHSKTCPIRKNKLPKGVKCILCEEAEKGFCIPRYLEQEEQKNILLNPLKYRYSTPEEYCDLMRQWMNEERTESFKVDISCLEDIFTYDKELFLVIVTNRKVKLIFSILGPTHGYNREKLIEVILSLPPKANRSRSIKSMKKLTKVIKAPFEKSIKLSNSLMKKKNVCLEELEAAVSQSERLYEESEMVLNHWLGE